MSPENFHAHAFKDAGHAIAEGGFVLLEGPDGVAVSLTPEAAQTTGENLIAAAEVARRQTRDDRN